MTLALKTKLSALAVALLVAAAVLLAPPTTASAGNGQFTIAGTAHLSQGVGATNAAGCFGGSATGFHGTSAAAGNDNAWATFSYNNPNTIEGDANGTLGVRMVDGSVLKVDFDWERIGGMAIIDFSKDATHNGNGVAGFAPTGTVSTHNCGKSAHTWSHPGPPEEHAYVGGSGVITH